MWDFKTDGADWDEELGKKFGGWEAKKPPSYISKLGGLGKVEVYDVTFSYADGEGHYADVRFTVPNAKGHGAVDKREIKVTDLFKGGPTNKNLDKIKKHLLSLYPGDKR
jgi:hypothetical protein